MTNAKDVKSFRLSKDVIAGINELKMHYTKNLKFKVSAANVIEILVNEKLDEIKGECKK